MDLEEIALGAQGTFELEFKDFCLFCIIIFELVHILYYYNKNIIRIFGHNTAILKVSSVEFWPGLSVLHIYTKVILKLSLVCRDKLVLNLQYK